MYQKNNGTTSNIAGSGLKKLLEKELPGYFRCGIVYVVAMELKKTKTNGYRSYV